MTPRLIPLRRPPVVVELEGPFVPSGVPLDLVDERWRSLAAANPRAFDGRMLAVLGTSRNGHGGVQIHARSCAYRFYAVQREGLDCGVRPLGAKAICWNARGFLMGRRSFSVAYYPGCWEFVPGGAVEPGRDPSAQVEEELREEVSLVPAASPVARALLYDPGAFSWEVVHEVRLADDASPAPGWEYDELGFFELSRLPSPLAGVAGAMRPIAERIQRA